MFSMSRSILVFASLTAFVIAGGICVGEAIVLASEQTFPSNRESDPIELRLTGGQMYGQFVNRPLFEVLDQIANQSSFKYLASQKLREHRVSGTFDGTPLSDALKKILKQFNYLFVSGATGEAKQLFVISMKSKARENMANEFFRQLSVVGVNSKTIDNSARSTPLELPAEKDLISTEAVPEEFDLTNGEPFLFEVPDNETSLPPEFKESTSSQTPESRKTGPKSTTALVRDLPDFEPISNNTGPIVPGLNIVDLPEFKRHNSDNGPSTH